MNRISLSLSQELYKNKSQFKNTEEIDKGYIGKVGEETFFLLFKVAESWRFQPFFLILFNKLEIN